MKSKITILSALVIAGGFWTTVALVGQDVPATPRPAPQPQIRPDRGPSPWTAQLNPVAETGHEVKILSLKKADASTTADQLKQLLSETRDLKIIADTRTNQLLLSGSAKDINTAEMLVQSLDSTETQQQPTANQFQLFAPANPLNGAAAGNTRPERAQLDKQIATAETRAKTSAVKIKEITDKLADAQAKAGDHDDGAKIDIVELKAQLAAGEREHAAIEDMLKDLADQRQATVVGGGGGGGGGRGGFAGGGGAAAGNPFGAAFGGGGGAQGGGGFGGGFGAGGGGAAGAQQGAVQLQFGQAGGNAGQGQIEINQDGKITRFFVPANGQPWEVNTTTTNQRQADQAVNALSNRLQQLKRIEQPTDAQKAQIADLTGQLRDSLDSQFKETQKVQIDEVAKLRDRLDNLQKEITDRNKNRESILDQRLEDVLSGKAPAPATPAAAGRRVGVAAVKAVPQGLPALNLPAAPAPADHFPGALPAIAPVVPVGPGAAPPDDRFDDVAPVGAAVPPPAVAPPAGKR